MNEAAPGIRRLCIAIATDNPVLPGQGEDGPASRSGADALRGSGSLSRVTLGTVLDEACATADVQRAYWVGRPEGGELGVFPPGIDERRVVAAFSRELRRAVAQANDAQADRAHDRGDQTGDLGAGDLGAGDVRAGGGGQLRLRVALHQGIVRCDELGYSGRAVVKACQLRDDEVLRRELAAHPDADVAFIVSAELFDDVADDDHSDLRRSEFRAVTVPAPVPGPGFVAWVSTPLYERAR